MPLLHPCVQAGVYIPVCVTVYAAPYIYLYVFGNAEPHHLLKTVLGKQHGLSSDVRV